MDNSECGTESEGKRGFAGTVACLEQASSGHGRLERVQRSPSSPRAVYEAKMNRLYAAWIDKQISIDLNEY